MDAFGCLLYFRGKLPSAASGFLAHRLLGGVGSVTRPGTPPQACRVGFRDLSQSAPPANAEMLDNTGLVERADWRHNLMPWTSPARAEPPRVISPFFPPAACQGRDASPFCTCNQKRAEKKRKTWWGNEGASFRRVPQFAGDFPIGPWPSGTGNSSTPAHSQWARRRCSVERRSQKRVDVIGARRGYGDVRACPKEGFDSNAGLLGK